MSSATEAWIVQVNDLCAVLLGARQAKIGTDFHSPGQFQHLILQRALVPVQGDQLVALAGHVFIDEPLAVHRVRHQPLAVFGDEEPAKFKKLPPASAPVQLKAYKDIGLN